MRNDILSNCPVDNLEKCMGCGSGYVFLCFSTAVLCQCHVVPGESIVVAFSGEKKAQTERGPHVSCT